MGKKKTKSVEDIVNATQSKVNKSFDQKMKAWEGFHDPEKEHALKFSHEADYVVSGKPSDMENYPGAYNESYKKLDSTLEGDYDKLKKDEEVESILETYVDHFLKAAMKDKFDEAMEHAQEEGLSDEDIREMKGNLFGLYHVDAKTGRTINPFDKNFIKQFKGKNKLEAIAALKGLAEQSKKMYREHLIDKATDGLITPYDLAKVAKHVGPKIKKAGFEHEDHPLTMSVSDLTSHYDTLLSGGSMAEHGYKKKLKKAEK